VSFLTIIKKKVNAPRDEKSGELYDLEEFGELFVSLKGLSHNSTYWEATHRKERI